MEEDALEKREEEEDDAGMRVDTGRRPAGT